MARLARLGCVDRAIAEGRAMQREVQPCGALSDRIIGGTPFSRVLSTRWSQSGVAVY